QHDDVQRGERQRGRAQHSEAEQQLGPQRSEELEPVAHRRGRWPLRPRGRAGRCVSHHSTPYLESLRYNVEGSMPRISAVRLLFPPSDWSTHMMYARSMTSSAGLAATGRSETSGSALRSVIRSGSATSSIT